MLIAHLPAGYVLGTAVRGVRRSAYAVMSAALFGSVAPDLDMFYFYTLGARQAHHHFYVTHWPLFWLALGVIVVPVVNWLRPRLTVASVVFFVAVMIHMVLDSIAVADAVQQSYRGTRHHSRRLLALDLEFCPALDLRARARHLRVGGAVGGEKCEAAPVAGKRSLNLSCLNRRMARHRSRSGRGLLRGRSANSCL